MSIPGNKWTRHFVLVEVTTLGCPSTKAVVDEIERMIDKSLPQLEATQVGRVEVKDLRKAKRVREILGLEEHLRKATRTVFRG